jgi:hypothetical protein
MKLFLHTERSNIYRLGFNLNYSFDPRRSLYWLEVYMLFIKIVKASRLALGPFSIYWFKFNRTKIDNTENG